MSFIKGIAKFISSLTLYFLCYLLLAYSGSMPLIPGLTVESIPALMPIVVGIGSVTSFISDGFKKALLQLLIEGGVVGLTYAISRISGANSDLITIFIWLAIIIICIPIIVWKTKTGRITWTWR